jgi:hypothetical protein
MIIVCQLQLDVRMTPPALDQLLRKRRELSARLFLIRCCIALLPVVLLHVIEQRSISFGAIVVYVVGIPALLWLYDRFILRRR